MQKKKNILPYYTIILEHLTKTKDCLIFGKITDAKSEICDLFVYLCEAKRYIDISIYNKALSFKNYFWKNIQESFFLKHLSLKDKKQIEFYLNELYDDVLERCIELKSYIKEFE